MRRPGPGPRRWALAGPMWLKAGPRSPLAEAPPRLERDLLGADLLAAYGVAGRPDCPR